MTPIDAVQRYERDTPADLLQIDIKKPGKFADVSHRITGDYTKRTRGLGHEYLFAASDDHVRVAITAMRPDERKGTRVRSR